MKKAMALMALTILTACDYAARKEMRAERDDRTYRAAMDDYRAGRMDAAVAGLEKVVRDDPSNASARFQLACLQQDLRKDFVAAYCGYREFLLQQPECDRAKLARERLAICEREVARTLSSKYGLNASDKLLRELDAVRAELKTSKARVAEAEKNLASSQQRIRTLSADRDRLQAAIRGTDDEEDSEGLSKSVLKEKEALEGGEDEESAASSLIAVRREKALLEKDGEKEESAASSLIAASREKALLEEDGEDEESAGSSLIPVGRTNATARAAAPKQDDSKSAKRGVERPKTYVVQEGDTLYGVAKRFYGGIQAWKSIREANKALISSDNRLRAGDTIVLP